MKKIALSLLVLATSGAYVWSQAGNSSGDTALNINGADFGTQEQASAVAPLLPATLAAPAVATASQTAVDTTPVAQLPAAQAPVVVAAVPAPIVPAADALPASGPAPAVPQIASIAPVVPAPRPTLPAFDSRGQDTTTAAAAVPAATPAQTQGAFVDGSYTGSAANAYYGLVQVQANIQGGRLASVKILQYPSDRRTSRYINSQALPILQREAISAQDANVDTVSGATLSSDAYISSLTSALQQARSGVVRS